MDRDLYKRAVDAYYRHHDEFAAQPNRELSGFTDPNRPDVIVLANVRGPLARLRYDEEADKLFWLEPKE